MLEFILTRTERQEKAKAYVSDQLHQFNVEGVETMIGDLTAPEALMKTLQDRKIAEESSATVQMQRDLASQRQQLERENAIADQQRALVTSEQNVKIAAQDADSARRKAEGEASVTKTRATAEAESRKISATAEGEATLARAGNEAKAIALLAQANSSKILQEGEAEAKVIQKKTEAIGQGNYAAIQVAEKLANGHLKLVPDIQLVGSGASGSAVEALLQLIAVKQLSVPAQDPTIQPPTPPILPG